MRRSQFFLPLLKETPADAAIASHQLMLRAGMIRQEAAGIYVWLPLGLKVLRNIERIVREEMDRAGAVELLMPTIQPAELWQESGRYDAYGKEMLRITDRHERALLFGPTNEEIITDIFRNTVKSYKDLPLNLYHIQWKFRDEIRPRFGVMRGREFLMKDAYSFDIDAEGARQAYYNMYRAYLRIFHRMGVSVIPVQAETGPIGGKLSHEFHIVAQTGESAIYFDKAFENIDFTDPALDVENLGDLYAAADEMHVPEHCPLAEADLRTARGIEVGHIFNFATKYSEALGAKVTVPDGGEVAVNMGSYGIGVSRLVGALIEAHHDDNGIKWPSPVAPFQVGLINLRQGDGECDAACERLYAELTSAGVTVLYDDRSERAGAKFAGMDLIGLPWQLAVGPKGIAEGQVELKSRADGEKHTMPLESATYHLTNELGAF